MRFAVAAATFLLAVPLVAQEPRLEVTLPAATRLTREGPLVRATGVISDSTMRDLIDNGFPARLRYTVERWSSGGVFNSLLANASWEVHASFDPMARRYRLQRIDGNGRIVSTLLVSSYATLVAEVERPMRAPLVARPHGDRQYYNVRLEVTSVSADDLDQLNRWLRGELQPAVRGERNPGTALGRGIRTLFARLLGAERRNLEARSGTFRVP
ncbi:MAG TPA: hypothetical protein VF178_05485 [Gemmatimonadaceae bacterium]